MTITIHPVQSKADKRAFYKFVFRVYHDDPNWVPHLWTQRKNYLDKQAAFFTYGEGDFWLAKEGREVVGTIGVALDVTHEHKLKRDIEAAHRVQQHLLPSKNPDLPGFDIAGGCFPAEHCSGDVTSLMRSAPFSGCNAQPLNEIAARLALRPLTPVLAGMSRRKTCLGR